MPETWKSHEEFEQQWGDLATYNADVARGLVHSIAWQARMWEKQQAYNREVLGQ